MELILLHCRPGFEKECAAEICFRGDTAGIPGYARTEPRQGFVAFHPHDPGGARRLYESLPLDALIFARQWFVATPELKGLPTADRISPLVNRLETLETGFGGLLIETPDTNEGKSLSRLARKLAPPLRAALARGGLWHPGEPRLPRAHLLLTGGQSAYAGFSREGYSARWPQGIPRLRLPAAAPSRAVLKLEEALLTFLDSEERHHLLREGRTAVDLGAAPGGWSWLLTRRGLQVTAVDNGNLLRELARSPQIEHLRVDGFTYRPAHPVHWLVCDMVEKPRRVATLMAEWFARGWCERALFNLKLPMKRRFDEAQQCLNLVRKQLSSREDDYTLRARQLYHDREEITVYLAPGGQE
ncbi:MAG: 23S rRNA (cytidine(2498)-2'-O)-methyltransferase RlmM [Gammaproteobacteria bacterium]